MTKEVEDLDFGLTIGEAYNSSFSFVCESRACWEKWNPRSSGIILPIKWNRDITEEPLDWQNLCAIARFRRVEVLFHLYPAKTRVRNIVRYTEDFVIWRLACEQALLFGRASQVSRERASERRSREGLYGVSINPGLRSKFELSFVAPIHFLQK